MSSYDYGPEVDALNAEYLRDDEAQKTLAFYMDEIEKARRELAHVQTQKRSKGRELRPIEKNLSRLENYVRMVFVNYALTRRRSKMGASSSMSPGSMPKADLQKISGPCAKGLKLLLVRASCDTV
jgi:hypothetical protein